MFAVTGATGDLGHRIVLALATLVAPDRIIACTRDPAKAADLAQRGVSVRQADYTDPASLARAFSGVGRLLCVSSNAASRGGSPLPEHRNVIAAAQQAGVSRLFYTSQIACSATSRFAPARDHAETEAMLATSGLAWTALRHGFYAKSGIGLIRHGLAEGTIFAPEDGPVSWTGHEDLALADALFLSGQVARIDGPTPPLTGTETQDFRQIAALASKALGRTIHHVQQTDAEFRATAAARSMPERAIDVMFGYFSAARAGEFAATDPTLERLIGRPPQRLSDALRATLA